MIGVLILIKLRLAQLTGSFHEGFDLNTKALELNSIIDSIKLKNRLRRPNNSCLACEFYQLPLGEIQFLDTFSINSIQANKSMPKSMKVQTIPSLSYSSCSNTNM